MPNLITLLNETQRLQTEFPDPTNSGARFRRWLPWVEPPTATPSPLPPLDPLQFLLRKGSRESFRRRSGHRQKHKKTKVTFMTKQASTEEDHRCSSSSANGISAFTVLNFLLAAGNTVSNMMNNNNNNNDNNNNNNNNALNLNVNSNNNNANNINNIDFGGPGRRRRRRRHLLAVPGQQAEHTQQQVPETKDDHLEREKATEIMMALLLVLDLSQAFRKETRMSLMMMPDGENLENLDSFRLSHHFGGSGNSWRRPGGVPDSQRFFFSPRRTKMEGNYVREAFETNSLDLSNFRKNSSDFFHQNESLSSSFVVDPIDVEMNNSSESHSYISSSNSLLLDKDRHVFRHDIHLSKPGNLSGNAIDNTMLSQRKEPVVENASDKHSFSEGTFKVTDGNRIFSIVCNSYRQADSFGQLTGFLVRVMTEEWLLPVYGRPVADC